MAQITQQQAVSQAIAATTFKGQTGDQINAQIANNLRATQTQSGLTEAQISGGQAASGITGSGTWNSSQAPTAQWGTQWLNALATVFVPPPVDTTVVSPNVDPPPAAQPVIPDPGTVTAPGGTTLQNGTGTTLPPPSLWTDPNTTAAPPPNITPPSVDPGAGMTPDPGPPAIDPTSAAILSLIGTGTNAYGPGGTDTSGTGAPSSTAGLQAIQPQQASMGSSGTTTDNTTLYLAIGGLALAGFAAWYFYFRKHPIHLGGEEPK